MGSAPDGCKGFLTALAASALAGVAVAWVLFQASKTFAFACLEGFGSFRGLGFGASRFRFAWFEAPAGSFSWSLSVGFFFPLPVKGFAFLFEGPSDLRFRPPRAWMVRAAPGARPEMLMLRSSMAKDPSWPAPLLRCGSVLLSL